MNDSTASIYTVETMLSKCQHLTKLGIHSFDHLNNIAFSILFLNSGQLKEFQMIDCNRVNVDGLKQFLTSNKQLESVKINKCAIDEGNWECLNAIGIAAPNLKRLEYFAAIDNKIGTQNATAFVNFQNLTSLTTNIWTCLGALQHMSNLTFLSQYCSNRFQMELSIPSLLTTKCSFPSSLPAHYWDEYGRNQWHICCTNLQPV